MGNLVVKGSRYSDEDRRRVVVEYCVLGNMEKVAKNLDMPARTLQHWAKNADWWVELVAEVRAEIDEQILAQNLEIAQKAGENVLDSLENGDEKLVWDKEKKEHVIKRVKPGAYQSMLVSGISQDKARTQLNLPTSISSNMDTRALAEQCSGQVIPDTFLRFFS